jgi:polysaccharide export outer membrane protein
MRPMPTLCRFLLLLALLPAACARYPEAPDSMPPAAALPRDGYVIGAGDQLNIFVWRSQDLSSTVTVRPDGRISMPLIEELPAGGRTPAQLARDIERALTEYVQHPVVTVMVNRFVGLPANQIRVVGEALKPRSLPYRQDMTVLDVLIEVGGLTTFAAGNRAVIVRNGEAGRQSFHVRLDDLVKDGDVTANVPMVPGDILIIPQSWL